jgi:hypothetical protein
MLRIWSESINLLWLQKQIIACSIRWPSVLLQFAHIPRVCDERLAMVISRFKALFNTASAI